MDSKVDQKIKNLNQIRKMYIRDFEEIESKYKKGDITEGKYNKHKEKFEKRKEKIRKQIHELEMKMSQ